MSQRKRSFLTVLFAVSVIVPLGGCSGVEADTSPVVNGTGNLPQAIRTMRADSLFIEGRKLSYVSAPWQKRNCEKGSCKARVQAVKNQKPGPGNVTTNGTIVARLRNRGDWFGTVDKGIEEKYDLKRLDDEEGMYYLVAISDGAQGWSWGIYEAIKGDTSRVTPIKSGTWADCTRDTRNKKHPQGDSEFARCPHPTDGAGVTALRYDPLDPAWLDCQQGCCTAGQ